MRAFIDTSSLFKRYVDEPGSAQLEELLDEKFTEIAVSPITWLEVNTVIARKVRERSLTSEQAAWLKSQANMDFQSFYRVIWSDALEKTATEFVGKYVLTTLDAIQLASGILSDSDLFVTSDQGLFKEARKALPKVMYI